MTIKRDYPDRPVIGLGAVIVDDERRVLLIRRASEPLKGQWSLPGGAMELGETLLEGVNREVREETGLEVSIVGPAGVYDRIIRDAAGKTHYQYVLIDYVCRVSGGELKAGGDAGEVRWVPENELAQLHITEFTLPVIRKVLAEL
ncbi:MAG TPA: NUDIX hydrolase [Terriglobales bacterium]|nr:NUDIX hydrolase [Terriglobales bacterium]